MRRKILAVNNVSGIFFFLSSVSLLGMPFLDQSKGLSPIAYVLAGIFWIGLLVGIGLQILASKMIKKFSGKKARTYKERRMAIPIALFLVLFVIIMCFWKSSLLLLSMDTAFLLFSIEIYFYMKRRYSV